MSIPSDSRRLLIRWFTLVLISTSAAYMIGCGSSGEGGDDPAAALGSGSLATEDLDLDITVSSSTPGRVVVGASLEYPTDLDVAPVELDGSDSIRAVLDGKNRKLERSATSTEPYYDTVFEANPAEGDLRVRFRGANFSVRLRPEFTVTSPTPGVVLGFQDDLDLQWTPPEPGHAMRIWIQRECRTTTGGVRGGSSYIQIPDVGAYAYDLGLLPEATDPAIDTSQDCSLDLVFEREAGADISPPLSVFSQMLSTQRRSVSDMSITF